MLFIAQAHIVWFHSFWKVSWTEAKIQKEMYFLGQVKCPSLYMDPYHTYTIYRQGYHSVDYEVSGKSLH